MEQPYGAMKHRRSRSVALGAGVLVEELDVLVRQTHTQFHTEILPEVGSNYYQSYLFGYTHGMNVIRELRRQAGLTQAQLAAAAGTSQPTIAAYESGTKSPRVRTLWRIARSVGLEPVISYELAFTR